eukprot:c20149_g2_i1 orf=130-489(+)
MRNQSGYTNHPMKPLAPKRQPWVMTQVTSPKKDSAKYAKEASSVFKHPTVQQELLLRERIEHRAMEKLEKLHEAVGLSRQTKRLQRQKSAGHIGEIVKALQEQENFKRSLSMGNHSTSP